MGSYPCRLFPDQNLHASSEYSKRVEIERRKRTFETEKYRLGSMMTLKKEHQQAVGFVSGANPTLFLNIRRQTDLGST
jgi:hypothetical protein